MLRETREIIAGVAMTVSLGTTAPEDEAIIKTERLFDAPRARVFEAFANEEQISQWWGPRGFSVRDSKFDFRVGGSWVFTFHHDEHGDFPNVLTYTQIVEDEYLAFDHGSPQDPQMHISSVQFEDDGDKTKITMVMRFKSFEEREQIIASYSAVQGQKETFDRLEELLAKGK